MENLMVDRMGENLGDIFYIVNDKNYDEKDFIKKFLKSDSFGYMIKNIGHRYWNFGEGYVVEDFTKKNSINEKNDKERNLYDIEKRWLGEIIMTLIEEYNIDRMKIANNLDNILKYTEFIDYHSPKEIIEKCNLS